MTKYEELKKITIDILKALPVDIQSDEGLVSVGTWETFEEREFKQPEVSVAFLTRKIGAQNVLEVIEVIEGYCQDISTDTLEEEGLPDVLTKLFEMIMDDLEEAKIIRKTPEFLRKDLRLVVDNTRNDRTEKIPSSR